MRRWTPLPEHLPSQVRRLVVRMRELRDETGASTQALARRTAYSRSSWQRYLNGRCLPPRRAVEALAQLHGADRTELLALWEGAAHARTLRPAASAHRGQPAAHGRGGPDGTAAAAAAAAGAWRPLPGSLEPELAYLVEVLRRLKDRSGLSLSALAARTPYSRSSWSRYLSGAKPPPRAAVTALAGLTGEPAGRLLALWQQSEASLRGRGARWQPADRTPADRTPADRAPAGA